MREILFRGKRLDNGEWVEGGLHIEWGETRKDGSRNKDYRILGMRGECYYVDPDTVGQYTGLTDKNGQKVFEGDILRGWSPLREKYYYVGPVEYGEFNCSCCDGVYGWCIRNGDIRVLECDNSGLEVCGNIHDNPDLLKGE